MHLKEVSTSEKELWNAIDKMLIGGNHLASNLISIASVHFPEMDKTHNYAMKWFHDKLGDTWLQAYEQWCAWKSCMEARENLVKHFGQEYFDKKIGEIHNG